jgi:hypothetical protein
LPAFEILQISLESVQERHKGFEKEVPTDAPIAHLTK